MGDVGNAFIQAKPREKCHVTITDNQLFGPSAINSKAIIIRALYGMKLSGAAWHETLAVVLKKELGFKNCIADLDLWLKEGVKKDGSEYYIYICVYVENLLRLAENPQKYILQIKDYFPIQEDSVESPKCT